MGLHSFLYADVPSKRMICGKIFDSYLLVPKEFGGGSFKETCYQGYSKMGGVDVFEELARWNKSALGKEIDLVLIRELPKREDYLDDADGDEYYRRACACFKSEFSMLFQYSKNRTDAYMRKHYGNDYLREIGILLFYAGNDKLKYPLKITTCDVDYESVAGYSDADTMQGCY